MKSRKIIITVAPVNHVGKPIPTVCKNPTTALEVGNEVIDCAKAGASMVHLHVRDNTGEQTFELDTFSKTLDIFTAKTDIVIQGSTGGLADFTLDERCVCLNDPRVEVASLNMGSVNFGEGVYINTFPDIRYWAKRMEETNVLPELECFDLGMIENCYIMLEEGVLKAPLHFNFCMNTKGALSANARNIGYMSSLLNTSNSHWGLTYDGMPDFSLAGAALAMGAQVLRIGFEDTAYYAPGKIAKSNVVLVEKLVETITRLGYDIATPAEARRMLGLS
ncbi:3-keto-5-aminohexanoate cleavage protein [Saccharicrinis sp. FJH54]|uniref:3-keto-5-aminohexanoate cleavage protein n=1 Tax=Saccharicrinis sp. FJH54 TaxID=3344665 RepID=UPI0035D44B50